MRTQRRFGRAALRHGPGHCRFARLGAQERLAAWVGGRQGRGYCAGVDRDERLTLFRRLPRQAVQWQPQSDGRIARNQHQRLAAQLPAFAHPARGGLPTLDGQHHAGGLVQAGLEGAQHFLAAFGVGQTGVGGVEVVRQAPLAQQGLHRVLIGVHRMFGVHAQTRGDGMGQTLGTVEVGHARQIFRWQTPQRLPVTSPIDGPRPARQGLPGYHLPWPYVSRPCGARRCASRRARL